MAHNHENCTTPQWGSVCNTGITSSYCDYEGCGDEYCVDTGHCECLCHSGKTCGCGHTWPRMEKGAHAAEEDVAVTAPAAVPAPRPATKEWAQALGDYAEEVYRKLWPPQ
jgi:hypothetical protein